MTRTLTGKRILLLDDDFLIASMTAEMLQGLGVAVVGPVSSLPKAIEAVRGETLHAAVLDVNIRGSASTPVANELRERGVPFVFATGYGDPPPGPWRAVPVLAKPYMEKDLETALLRALGLTA